MHLEAKEMTISNDDDAISEEGRIAKLGKKGKICIKRLTKEALIV